MRLNEVVYNAGLPVDGYGEGFFRIGGVVHNGAVIVLPSGVKPWGGYTDVTPLADITREIDVLFVGTGREISHLPASFRETLEASGLGVEPMTSPAACRTYNVLLSEGRRVGLALLPV